MSMAENVPYPVNGIENPLALCRLSSKAERRNSAVFLSFANPSFLRLWPIAELHIAQNKEASSFLPRELLDAIRTAILNNDPLRIQEIKPVISNILFYVTITPLTSDTAALKLEPQNQVSVDQQRLPWRYRSAGRVGCWEYLHDGQLACDDNLCRILGVSSEEQDLTMDSICARIPLNELKDFQKKYSCALQRKRDFSQIHRITGFDGRELYLLQRIKIEFDQEANPVKTIGLAYDISTLKAAEQKLERQNQILHSLIYCTQQLLGAKSIQDGINNSLRSFGIASEACRSFFYTFMEEPQHHNLAILAYEWNRDNELSSSLLPQKRHVRIDPNGDFFQQLSNHRSFSGMRSEAEGQVLQVMASWNIFSFIAFPIFINGKLKGFIGISDLIQERRWTIAEQDILQLYAETISMALERDLREQKLNQMISKSMQSERLLKNSETRYRSLLTAIPDLLFVHDLNGVITDFHSPSPDKLLLPPEQFLGRSLQDIMPPAIAEGSLKYLNEVLATGEIANYQYDLEMKGELRRYDARMVPFGNDTVLTMVRDVTEQVRMEKALITSENKFRLLFDRMLSGAAFLEPVFDRENNRWRYRFLDVNTFYENICGMKRQELLHKFIEDVFPESFTSWMNIIHEITLAGNSRVFEFHHKNTGKYFSCSAFKPEEKKNYFCVIFNDITSLKQTQHDLIVAKEKAEESDQLKSSFLSNMSHEIRTPLNTIIGLANLITERELSNSERCEYAKLINQSSTQLLTLISDIIDIAKIESGQLRLSKNNFCVNDVMEKLYELFSAQLRKNSAKNIDLFCKRPLTHDEAIIHTDDTRLIQILTNMLNNAMKFTTRGFVEMGYFLSENRRELIFYVKDTGTGIPQFKQDVIFERFRQADDSFTRVYGGAGLGLAICKNLVELLGGRIWVKSILGKGSCFYFSLPYERQEETPSQRLSRQILPENMPKFSWPDKKILIVEDTPTVLYYLKRILEFADIKCLTAVNGKEAIDMCRVHRDIHLILMDIQMPEMNGYEATEKIKKMWPEIPIVAQTAYAYASEIDRAMSCGCSDYLIKPIKKSELLTKIAVYLNSK